MQQRDRTALRLKLTAVDRRFSQLRDGFSYMPRPATGVFENWLVSICKIKLGAVPEKLRNEEGSAWN